MKNTVPVATAFGPPRQRLSAARCHNFLRQLAAADLMPKGRAPLQRQNIWEEIESIGLGACGVEV